MSAANLKLLQASSFGDVANMEAALKQGADINASDAKQWGTPLLWAIYCLHQNAVALLLKQGADLNVVTGKGLSTKYNNKNVFELLDALGNANKSSIFFAALKDVAKRNNKAGQKAFESMFAIQNIRELLEKRFQANQLLQETNTDSTSTALEKFAK